MKATHAPALPRNENLISVGLEIGTTKICAAVGEVIPDGTLKIRGIASAPSLGVSRGDILPMSWRVMTHGQDAHAT